MTFKAGFWASSWGLGLGLDLGLEAWILTFDSWMERGEGLRRRKVGFELLLGLVWAFRLDFVP